MRIASVSGLLSIETLNEKDECSRVLLAGSAIGPIVSEILCALICLHSLFTSDWRPGMPQTETGPACGVLKFPWLDI